MNQQLNWEYILSECSISHGSVISHLQGQILIKIALLLITKRCNSLLVTMKININCSSLLLREAAADSEEVPTCAGMADPLMGGPSPHCTQSVS